MVGRAEQAQPQRVNGFNSWDTFLKEQSVQRYRYSEFQNHREPHRVE
jgi:hypothetical protein